MHNIFYYLNLCWQPSLFYLSSGLIILGLWLVITGMIGILKFKDFFARIHANGIIDSCGIPMIIVGVALKQQQLENAIKMIILAFIILIISPLNTHILAKMAFLQLKKND